MKPLIILIVVLAASCGSLRPATTSHATRSANATAASTRLTAVEGRPSGVVLRLEARDPRTTSIELYRVVTGGEPTILQSLAVDDRLRDSLAEGLEIVDSTVRAGEELTYQLFAVGQGDEVIERSALTTVSWNAPPPRPVDLVAIAPFVDVVELSWKSNSPAFGAMIFRRDVLAGTGFERVAVVDAPASDWVDRNVGAAGVWSYRVALAQRSADGFVQLGTPSEEVYASTPEQR